MKQLRLFTFAAILSASGIGSLCAETATCLKLHYYDGTETAIRLSENPAVRVEEGFLVVDYGTQQVRGPLGEIRSFNVEEAEVETGLQTALGESLSLRWTGPHKVFVGGARTVLLYSVDGRLLARFAGDTELDLREYTTEILIIKADGKTFKISK